MTATLDTAPVATRARVLSAPTPDLATHAHVHGPVPWHGRGGSLVGEVQAAGLLGRGGAGFPTAVKMAGARDHAGRRRRAVVVANAAEGEPASAKDATLLRHTPHLVLDGLQLAAEAVGADRAFLYVKGGPAAAAARRALAARRSAGWDRLPVQVVTAADAFVAGEESAVVSALEGGPPTPRFKRRLLVESGYRGRPTLVQNVETLAHLALIARHGPAWYRETGTAAEPGTFLATVGGAVVSPQVVEVPYGLPLGDLLDRAGGPTGPLRSVLLGGYHGTWLPGGALADLPMADLPMSREALSPFGASPGAGVVLALQADACGLDVTARIVTYLSEQSAGSCGPCLFGLSGLAETLTRLAWTRPARHSAGDAARLADLVERRGACRHPDGTVRLVRSALRAFADDVDAHTHSACVARRDGPR